MLQIISEAFDVNNHLLPVLSVRIPVIKIPCRMRNNSVTDPECLVGGGANLLFQLKFLAPCTPLDPPLQLLCQMKLRSKK